MALTFFSTPIFIHWLAFLIIFHFHEFSIKKTSLFYFLIEYWQHCSCNIFSASHFLLVGSYFQLIVFSKRFPLTKNARISVLYRILTTLFIQQLLCQRVRGRPIICVDPDRVVTIVLFISLSLYDSHTHCTIGLKRTRSMLCLYLCNSVCRVWYRRFSSFFFWKPVRTKRKNLINIRKTNFV